MKISSDIKEDIHIPEYERIKGAEMAEKISMASLGMIWQILFKGYQELQNHEMPHMVAEMILIRLAFASELPSLEEISNNLKTKSKEEEITKSTENKAPITTENEKKTDDLSEDKKQTGTSSDTVMEMRNIETLAKKQRRGAENMG